MGTATSSTNLFRSLGGAIGAATFGAVLGIRLDHYLVERRGDAAGSAAVDANDIQALPEPTRHLVLSAFTDSLNEVFLVCIPFIAIALVIALTLREIPLRSGASPVKDMTETAAGDPEISLPPVGD